MIYLVNTAGVAEASYAYDPYGSILSSTGSLANVNPLRYRGYYYDTETGLYYLQSRYYDPVLGRFINADSYSSTGQGFLGYNMFAYCCNNPISGFDPTGEFSLGKLFSGAGLLSIGLTACAVAVTVVTGGACAPLVAAAAVTFAAGGVTVVNGASEVAEAVTGYNPVKDGLYGGNEAAYERDKTISSTIAQIGTMVLTAAQSYNLCFIAGTPVLTDCGTKPIEEVQKGDLVWAWDEASNEVALKQVVETYVNEATELTHVLVNGEEIVSTPNHPFYSPVKGWTEACKLRAGDILVLVNGDYVVVEKVQHELLESPINVFNFQVQDYHTYYVASGVLVHNSCGETPHTQLGKQKHRDWDYGGPVKKEHSIPGVGRADGVDFVNRIVYELKPNNARAIRQGWRQLNKYAAALEGSDGGTWIRILETYSK